MDERPHTVVVGGTKGLGQVIAETFLRKDHRVSALGRSSPVGGSGEKTAEYIKVDFNDRNALEASLALLLSRGPFQNLIFTQRQRGGQDLWQDEIEVSLTATQTITACLSKELATGSSIVFVSSVAGDLVAQEQGAGYHVSKAGLNHLARYYAVTLGPRGIRCNSVSPSIFIKEENRSYHEDAERSAFYRKVIPLGRAAAADEICNVIAFLCSPEASYVTGQNIYVDGGLSVQAHLTLARAITPDFSKI
jgi:NAD(P)-dependent dehydrogenase (short-subunit alcohol dehydrogenase family)